MDDSGGAQGKPEIGTEPSPKTVETAEALLAEVDRLGVELRTLIVRCKSLTKTDENLEPYQKSKRALELAQEHLQTGILWLRKCITRDVRF